MPQEPFPFLRAVREGVSNPLGLARVCEGFDSQEEAVHGFEEVFSQLRFAEAAASFLRDWPQLLHGQIVAVAEAAL